MTKHTLAENQHPHEMTLIVYHLHKNKLQANSRVTQLPLIDAHQCHTPAALSRAYLEKPGHMIFLNQHSMSRHSLRIPRISRFLKNFPQSENLVCGATWM